MQIAVLLILEGNYNRFHRITIKCEYCYTSKHQYGKCLIISWLIGNIGNDLFKASDCSLNKGHLILFKTALVK